MTVNEAGPRNIVITGGASSVGRVAAEKFYKLGDQVAILDISQDAVDATIAANPNMVGFVGSIGDADIVQTAFSKILDQFGHIDVLVNCVGVPGPTAALEDIDIQEWNNVFAVNVSGVFHCMKMVTPSMKARKSGAIINYSSSSTNVGLPNRTPYIASKSAVEGLTHTAARELGPYNIRCNAILPGVIDNERMQSIIEQNAQKENITVAEMEQKYLKYVSMRTKISPEELADLTVYLASDAARHLTGQMIELSGLLEWEK